MKFLPLLVSLGFLTCLDGVASAAEKYEVRISRQLKVGDRFTVSAMVAAEHSFVASMAGGNSPETQHSTYAGRFKGELKILAVTPDGMAREAEFKLTEAEVLKDGKKAAQLEAGDLVRIRDQGFGVPDEVTVNGAPSAPEVGRMMFTLLPMKTDRQVTDSAIFDPKERVEIGSEWSINREAWLLGLAQLKAQGFERDDIKGTVRLTGTATLGAQPALQLEFRVVTAGEEISLPQIPVETVRFFDETDVKMEVPVDLANPAFRRQTNQTHKLSGPPPAPPGAPEKRTIEFLARYATDLMVMPVR